MTASNGLVVIQPGNKLPSLDGCPGDFADWILAGMGWSGLPVSVIRPQLGEPLPRPSTVSAVVVTGSSAMVTDPGDWIARSSDWLAEMVAMQSPVLGICFGHQLLAHALGGCVGDNPNGVEVGTVVTRPHAAAAQDPLFSSWCGEIWVQASHRQSVWELPPGGVCLASSDLDPHHAFRFGRNCWGVQFHPEFSPEVVKAYIRYYRMDIEERGDCVDNLQEKVIKTPKAAGLLADFGQLLGN